MAEKTIRVYDGIKYKDVTYNEIEDAHGNPTGRYTTVKEEDVTILGTYLDIQENYDRLQEDIMKLSQGNKPYVDHNHLFTDFGERQFLFANSVKSGVKPADVLSTPFDGVIKILSNLGYVNAPYVQHLDMSPPSIEFTVTPKDGQSSEFKMYFMPMDQYCYQIK